MLRSSLLLGLSLAASILASTVSAQTSMTEKNGQYYVVAQNSAPIETQNMQTTGTIDYIPQDQFVPGARTYTDGSINNVPGVADEPTLEKELGVCQKAVQHAIDACDPKGTVGMNTTEAMTMAEKMSLIGQLSQMAGSASGSASVCAAASGLSSAAQTVSLLKSKACKTAAVSCSSNCEGFVQDLNEARNDASARVKANSADAKAYAEYTSLTSRVKSRDEGLLPKQCAALSAKADTGMTQYMMLGQSVMQTQKCLSQTSSNAALVAPTLGTGATDCSNASFAATNTYCICKANPSDGMCSSLLGGTNSAGGSAGGLSGGGTPGIASATATDGSLVDPTAVGGKGTSGGYGPGSSAGGGGLGAGGPGGGLAGGDGGGGPGGSGLDKNVITGTSGGGGGLAGLSAAGGGGGGGRLATGSGGGSSSSGFNFKNYLPKSLFKNRGLAGMTVPSTDGMTGPMGPTIWEKVSTQMQHQKPTLIQEK